VGIFAFYAWLPADGATGDLESFSPQGYRVQWLLETREGGLQVEDLIVRAGGFTVDEWLGGAPRGPEWRNGGLVPYQIQRQGQEMRLPIRLAPVPLWSVLKRWAPQLMVSLAFLAVGIFVFCKRPYELSARLMMLICITVALQLWGDAYNFQYAIVPWRWPLWLHLALEQVTFFITYASVSYLALIFPVPHPLTNRFPRLMPLTLYASFFLVVSVVMALQSTWSKALESGNRAAVAVSLAHWMLVTFAAIRSAIVARDPVTRAQIRWILWIGIVFVVVVLPGYLLPLVLTGRPLIPHPVVMLMTAGIPFIFATAILRYRLWDIDIIINRTLVYAALTGALGLVFFGCVALLQRIFQAFTGQQSDLAIVISTLVSATLFQPLRRRFQALVDRHFYRAKVDFRQALIAFSREVRTIIDLPHLLHVLINRVTDLLHITHGAVFLIAADGANQLATARNLPSGETLPASLEESLMAWLRSGEIVHQPKDPIFPLLVPLAAPRVEERDLVGVLALGPRLSGQGYSRDDQALLMGLADQAGTAIYVAQLIEEKQEEVRRKEAAEAASRAKSAFLADVSHELRTPLNAIIGYSELLQEEAQEEGHAGLIPDLAKIRTAGKHLLSIISDVLDLSKIEAGRIDLYLENFSLQHLIEGVVNTAQPLVEEKGNTLHVDQAEDLGTMVADLTKVRQILLNLLSNSAKFTQAGHITLTIKREWREAGDWITFQVADTGIGITPGKLAVLFGPFTQADASITRKYGGSGLGLAIAKRFCETMGGEITVHSKPGQGSTFTVRLPAVVAAQPVIVT
jgi:signal transduction histidine kinase